MLRVHCVRLHCTMQCVHHWDNFIQCAPLCKQSVYMCVCKVQYVCTSVEECSPLWRQSVTTKWCVASTFRSSSVKAKCHKVATFLPDLSMTAMGMMDMCVGWWQQQNTTFRKHLEYGIVDEHDGTILVEYIILFLVRAWPQSMTKSYICHTCSNCVKISCYN